MHESPNSLFYNVLEHQTQSASSYKGCYSPLPISESNFKLDSDMLESFLFSDFDFKALSPSAEKDQFFDTPNSLEFKPFVL
jgi:hypothetical protein